MYIAMNRFPIAGGFEDAFVEAWRTRDSKLDTVPPKVRTWARRHLKDLKSSCNIPSIQYA